MPKPSFAFSLLALSMIVVALGSGCHSASSTHVLPNPETGGWDTKKIPGIPVTVKVPTHLELKVIKRTYINPGTFDEIQSVRFVKEHIHHKDQLFMVDSVRPASGLLTMSAKMQEKNQFFSTYNTKIEDNTIKTITSLVPNLGEVLGNLKKARVIADDTNAILQAEEGMDIPYVDSVQAVKVFEVNSPSLTDDVREFLATHINCAPDCRTTLRPQK